MLRKPRLEYPGAIYHLMSRGNRQDKIFLNDVDRQEFLMGGSKAANRLVHEYMSTGGASGKARSKRKR